MNKIRKELLYSTKALLSGRDYGKNPTPVEEESRRELMKVEAEALRIALRPPLSQNLRKLLPILVDADDEFVPISRLAERAELCSERSVRTALARLNRKAEGNSGHDVAQFSAGKRRDWIPSAGPSARGCARSPGSKQAMTAVNCVNRIVRGDRPDRQFVAAVRGVQSIIVERYARGRRS